MSEQEQLNNIEGNQKESPEQAEVSEQLKEMAKNMEADQMQQTSTESSTNISAELRGTEEGKKWVGDTAKIYEIEDAISALNGEYIPQPEENSNGKNEEDNIYAAFTPRIQKIKEIRDRIFAEFSKAGMEKEFDKLAKAVSKKQEEVENGLRAALAKSKENR